MKRIKNKLILYCLGILIIIFFFVFPLGMQDEIRINNDFTIAGNEIHKNFYDVLYEPKNIDVWLKNAQTPMSYIIINSTLQNKFTRIGKNENEYQTIIININNSEIGTVGGKDIHLDNYNYTLLSNNNVAVEKLNIKIIPNGYETNFNVNYTYDYTNVNFIRKTIAKWYFILNPKHKNDIIEKISDTLKGYLMT